MSHTRTSIAVFFFAVYLFALPYSVFAEGSSDLNISPVVIDEKAKARDILKQSITVTNTSNRKLDLYPTVNDIDTQSGEEDFVSAQSAEDRAASLANWIELSRGVVELGPGEEKTIPFTIRVNLNAIPGSYHAQVSFSEGHTRAVAEKKEPLAAAIVNLEVKADIKEVMQLNSFKTDNVFFSGDDVLFNYQFENLGNQELQPKGEIRIYDRKGKEVTSLDINPKGEKVAPDQVTQLASVWSAVSGFGKYKAFLTVDYGNTQTASVQDTVFFWIIPWKQLLALFVGSLILVIFLSLYFHKMFDRRHGHQLAVAGHPGMTMPVTPESKKPVQKPKSARNWSPIGWTRSLLSMVQRSKKEPLSASASAPEAPPAPLPSRAAEVPQQPVAPVSPPPAPAPVSAGGHQIDLKALRSNKEAAAAPVSVQMPSAQSRTTRPQMDGHVINLKKK